MSSIYGTIIEVSPINKPSEKDLEKGLKIRAVLKVERPMTFAGKEHIETTFVFLKFKETSAKVGEKYVCDGFLWSVGDDTKGMNEPRMIKVG